MRPDRKINATTRKCLAPPRCGSLTVNPVRNGELVERETCKLALKRGSFPNSLSFALSTPFGMHSCSRVCLSLFLFSDKRLPSLLFARNSADIRGKWSENGFYYYPAVNDQTWQLFRRYVDYAFSNIFINVGVILSRDEFLISSRWKCPSRFHVLGNDVAELNVVSRSNWSFSLLKTMRKVGRLLFPLNSRRRNICQ